MFLQVTLTAAYVTTCLRSPAMNKREASDAVDECYRQYPSNQPILDQVGLSMRLLGKTPLFLADRPDVTTSIFDVGKVPTSVTT